MSLEMFRRRATTRGPAPRSPRPRHVGCQPYFEAAHRARHSCSSVALYAALTAEALLGRRRVRWPGTWARGWDVSEAAIFAYSSASSFPGTSAVSVFLDNSPSGMKQKCFSAGQVYSQRRSTCDPPSRTRHRKHPGLRIAGNGRHGGSAASAREEVQRSSDVSSTIVHRDQER